MLRSFVLLLLLANAAFFAWSQGYLAAWGLAPVVQSEPQRVAQQIRPEAIRLLKPEEARKLDSSTAAAPRVSECLQVTALQAGQAAALRKLLEGWPAGSWNIDNVAEPERWIVYMGKYPNAEQVERKKAELRQLGVSGFDSLTNKTLEPGLSLGGFPSQADATRHLERLSQRGVRTARVVKEREETNTERLQLPAVDDTLRARLDELKPALNGAEPRPCR